MPEFVWGAIIVFVSGILWLPIGTVCAVLWIRRQGRKLFAQQRQMMEAAQIAANKAVQEDYLSRYDFGPKAPTH